MTYFASDFKDVDGADAVQTFTQCLELQRSLPSYQEYKQKTFEQMHLVAGASVLEVGCGTGEDAIVLARLVGNTGKVVAIDLSQAMLDQASRNARQQGLLIDFLKADAQHLPLPDNAFDAARVDRTLQHISAPQTAIAEMARVVRPQGWVVAMEPDWGTFVIDSEHRAVTRQLLNFWCDSFPSGWVGRKLYKYMRQVGLNEIQINPVTIFFTQLELADRVLNLEQTAHRAVEKGSVTETETEAWLNELQELDQAKEFFASFTAFIVSGRKSDSRT